MTCTCDLELSYSASEEDGEHIVIDAECTVVATCKEARFAEMIAYALNRGEDCTGPCIEFDSAVEALRKHVDQYGWGRVLERLKEFMPIDAT